MAFELLPTYGFQMSAQPFRLGRLSPERTWYAKSEECLLEFIICKFYSVRGLRAEASPDREITVT